MSLPLPLLLDESVLVQRGEDAKLAPAAIADAICDDRVSDEDVRARLHAIRHFSATHKYDTLVAVARKVAALDPTDEAFMTADARIRKARLLLDHTHANLAPLVVHCVLTTSLVALLAMFDDADTVWNEIFAAKWLDNVARMCTEMLSRMSDDQLRQCELDHFLTLTSQSRFGSWQLSVDYAPVARLRSDAYTRAEFQKLAASWHTLLVPFHSLARASLKRASADAAAPEGKRSRAAGKMRIDIGMAIMHHQTSLMFLGAPPRETTEARAHRMQQRDAVKEAIRVLEVRRTQIPRSVRRIVARFVSAAGDVVVPVAASALLDDDDHSFTPADDPFAAWRAANPTFRELDEPRTLATHTHAHAHA